MKRIVSAFRVFAFCALLPSSALIAQSYLNATGNPSFGVNIPVENGFINIANGNLHMEFPLATMKQRGALQLNERLVYDSRIWSVVNNGTASWQPTNVPNTQYAQGGWRFDAGADSGSLSGFGMVSKRVRCTPSDPAEGQTYYDTTYRDTYSWVDPSGTSHPFDTAWFITDNLCGDLTAAPESRTGWASDGSGYKMSLSGDTLDAPTITIIDASGTQVYPSIADRYGNYWSSDSNGNLIDDLGRTPVIVTTNGNVTYYDVLAPSGTINNNGTRVRYTVTTAPVSVATQFGASGVTEFNGTLNPVQSIQLPDGGSYTFSYDAYGELANVTLPTGGVITYGWSNYIDSYQNTNRWLTSRTMGSNPAMTFLPLVLTPCTSGGTGCQEQVTLHKPSGDETVYQFTLNNGAWNTNVTAYGGSASSGTALVSVANTYDFSNICQTACTGSEYITKSTATTTLPGTTLNTQTQYVYGAPQTGKLTSLQQWDYYTGTPSSLPTRETDYTYSSTGYDLTQTTSYDSGHNQVAQTKYGYTTSATATSGLPQHGTANAGGPYLQTVSNWVNTSNTFLVTTYAMDDSGMVLSVTDPNGNKSNISYQCSNAFPYQASNALNQTTTYSYDCNSGALLSTKDPNDSAASRAGTVYQYEATAGRIHSITYPDGGQTSYSYPSATEVDTSILATPDPTITSQTIVDSFGRPYQQVKAGVSSETTYDANGRVNCVTNPHLSASSSTDGTACITTYDGLDRPTLETEQDGNTLIWSYHGNTVTSTDEASHSWQRTSDAFGELTNVTEPGSLQTNYSYDALGNLLTIAQNGTSGDTPRLRTFIYDSLSRMQSATTPEAGATTYSYLANGSMCSGDPTLPCSTTDARGIAINYTYDTLNRLTDRQSQGGSGVPGFHYGYFYDSPTTGTGGAFASSNPIGRVVEAANYVNASEQYSYDAMGRVIVQANTLPSTCCDAASQTADEVKAQYDLAGNITQLTYPDGRVVTQTYNNLGQMLTSVFDNYNGQHEGYTYASGITYTPAGAQAEITLGNGVYIHTPYDSREQMCQVWSNGYQTWVDTHIYYGSEIFCGNTPGNNGNISEVKDWRNQNRTRHFVYDSLNRITSFNTNDNTMQQGYTYDSFGNLMNQTGTLNPSFTVGANNQLTSGGYSYDAAGNATQYDNNGTTSTLQFNAENKVVNFNSGTATYTYEATGSRARKDVGVSPNNTWTEYVNFNGQPLAERHQDGTWSDYIYANGQKIARADNYDVRIHFSGTNCSNCGPQAWAYTFQIPQYVIQSGDKIAWRQYQTGPAVPRGGITLLLNGNIYTAWQTSDQDGQEMNNDATQNAWHYRMVDLSQYAGDTISAAWLVEDTQSGAGNWDEYFSDIAYYRTDGTVVPIYHRQTGVSYSGWGSSGVTNQKFEINVSPNLQWEMADNTTYYIGDQTGSVREEFGGEGWPVSSSVFYPFGVEQTTTTDPNSYKFATLERDSESNLDHAAFRQYTPLAGRWMSPDPYNGSYDLNNPQSFNRYSYALNNPLNGIDPTGLCDESNQGGATCPQGTVTNEWDPGNQGSCDIDGASASCSTAFGILSSGAGCLGSCVTSVHGLYGTTVQAVQTAGPTVYVGPNGDELDEAGAAELGLPSLPGSDVGEFSFDFNPFANGGTGATSNMASPPACQAKILNAINNQFGKNYTNANVNSTFNYSTGAPPGQGTLNLNIYGSMAGVSTGYYPVNWWTYVIGYGSTLHVVSGPGGHGGLDSLQTLPFGPNQGTFHIDSGYVYNPFGAFSHWLLNMTKAGGYPQC